MTRDHGRASLVPLAVPCGLPPPGGDAHPGAALPLAPPMAAAVQAEAPAPDAPFPAWLTRPQVFRRAWQRGREAPPGPALKAGRIWPEGERQDLGPRAVPSPVARWW